MATPRKKRPYRTLAELERMLELTPLTDRRARGSIQLAIKYRTNPEYRLRGINRIRKQLGIPLAQSLDDVERRLENGGGLDR